MGMLCEYAHTWPSGPYHRATVWTAIAIERMLPHVRTFAYRNPCLQWIAVGVQDYMRAASLSRDTIAVQVDNYQEGRHRKVTSL